MAEGLHIAIFDASPFVCGTANDGLGEVCNYDNMVKRKKSVEPPPKNYLLEWRKFRKMTQEQLAEALKTDKSVISLIENSERKLSHKWAKRLAVPLKIQPGWLLDFSPEDVASDILELWGDIPEENKPHARTILETFRKKSTV